MSIKKFDSPREEALELAIQNRNKILEGTNDTISDLRTCFVIANNLNKSNMVKWITNELQGTFDEHNIPYYRHISCLGYDNLGNFTDKFEDIPITNPIHALNSDLQTKGDSITYHCNKKRYRLQKTDLKTMMATLTDECFVFLNDMISELQYGGVVEYLMEEIRKGTDEKIAKLDEKLRFEAKSMFENLTSTNPADWNKVGHSSRKMLQIIADKVFPPSDEKFNLKNGTSLKTDSQCYINRIIAFLDQKTSGEEKKYKIAEIEFLDNYLRRIADETQAVEHKPSVEKYRADMLAVHTYLIISEILRYLN